MKRLFLFLFFTSISSIIFSQTNEEIDKEIDAIIDELITDEANIIEYIDELNKYQFIYLSIGFNNKTYFLGRDLGVDQYNITPQILYEHHSGFYAGLTGVYYSKFDPKWDLTTATLGYNNDFGKHDNFRYDISYSRYFFSNQESIDFKNSLDASFSAETKSELLGLTVSGAYFFGKKDGYQASIGVYSSIDLFKINSKNEVSFNPPVSFIFGSENIDTSRITDLQLSRPFIDRILDSFEAFNLRNIQLNLPIHYSLDSFQFELGYNINFPKKLEFERTVSNTSYFNLGISYIFSF